MQVGSKEELNVELIKENIRTMNFIEANALLKGQELDWTSLSDFDVLDYLAMGLMNYQDMCSAEFSTDCEFAEKQIRAIKNICQDLLAQIDINSKDKDQKNNTLLQQAILEGKSQKAILLINHGADLNHVNDDDQSALQLFAEKGGLYPTLFLLSKGAKFRPVFLDYIQTTFYSAEDVFSDALFRAIEICDSYLFEKVIKYAQDLSKLGNENFLKKLLNAYNAQGLTALHLATEKENLIFIQELLNAGADVNKKSDTGQKPIFMLNRKPGIVVGPTFLFKGNVISTIDLYHRIISLYAKAGFNMDEADADGQTLLDIYRPVPYFSKVVELLTKDSNNNMRNEPR
jgi:ankyrin repeat protein